MSIKNLFFLVFLLIVIFSISACNTQEPKVMESNQKKTLQQRKSTIAEGITFDTSKTKVKYVPKEVEHTYPIKNRKINYDCSKACYNYKKCTSYTKGITQQGLNDAFKTCFDACQQWSKATIDCMSNCKIHSAANCICPTQCGLSEYNTNFPSLTGTF